MKGGGLDNPRTGRWPFAVVQLRQDNALATLWNVVGFQTKLNHGEQVGVFRTILGLEKAEFARLGGIHRNSSLTRRGCSMSGCGSRARSTFALPGRSLAAKAMSKARRLA